MAMRRLISLLRQSQTYCTDTECLQELPGPQGAPTGGNSFMLLAMCWVVLAFALYMLRPKRLTAREDAKPPRTNNDRDGNPPPPPMAN